MSQVTNFYPIVNALTAMTAFSRLVELGAKVEGKSVPDFTFQAGEVFYSLYVEQSEHVQGYRINANDKPVTQGAIMGPHSAEVFMQKMIAEYEDYHRGKLPFVMMVKDGDDEVKLFLDGSILITSERGGQLAEMVERHPDMVTQALENILTSTI